MITGYKRGRAADGIRSMRPVAALVLLGLVMGLWTGWLPAPGLGGASASAPVAHVRPADNHHDH